MPVYNIQLPDGRTVRFQGDSPPTAEDYAGVVAAAMGQKPQVEEPSSITRRIAGDIPLGLAKGVVGATESAVGLLDIAHRLNPVSAAAEVLGMDIGSIGNMLGELGYKPKETKQIIGALQSKELRDAQKKVSEAKGFTGTVSELAQNPSAALDMLAESVPGMLVGGAAGRTISKIAPSLAAVAPAIGEGAMSAGSTASQIVEDTGGLTPKQAALSTGVGIATGGINLLGNAASNKLGVADIDALVAGQQITKAQGSRMKRTLLGGAIESGEETIQSGQEQAGQNLALGKPMGQGVMEAAGSGAVLGGVMGVGSNLLFGGGSITAKADQAASAGSAGEATASANDIAMQKSRAAAQQAASAVADIEPERGGASDGEVSGTGTATAVGEIGGIPINQAAGRDVAEVADFGIEDIAPEATLRDPLTEGIKQAQAGREAQSSQAGRDENYAQELAVAIANRFDRSFENIIASRQNYPDLNSWILSMEAQLNKPKAQSDLEEAFRRKADSKLTSEREAAENLAAMPAKANQIRAAELQDALRAGQLAGAESVPAAGNARQRSPFQTPTEMVRKPNNTTRKNKSDVTIGGLDAVIANGQGQITVQHGGVDVPFDQFVVSVNENEAEVGFVRIKNRGDASKGIGTLAYIRLGEELAKRGITLRSSGAQYAPGNALWARLAKMGYAVRKGNGWAFSSASESSDAPRSAISGRAKPQGEDLSGFLPLDREAGPMEFGDLPAQAPTQLDLAEMGAGNKRASRGDIPSIEGAEIPVVDEIPRAGAPSARMLELERPLYDSGLKDANGNRIMVDENGRVPGDPSNARYPVVDSVDEQSTKSLEDRIYDGLESIKVFKKGRIYGINPVLGIPAMAWDGAIIAAQQAVRAGARVAEAVKAAIDYLNAKMPDATKEQIDALSSMIGQSFEPSGKEVGFHLGDLGFGRDTAAGRMGGRSTGHFGTGVYFTSEKGMTSSGREDRPLNKIDLSKFKLWTPARYMKEADRVDSAKNLHGALEKVNKFVSNQSDSDLLRRAAFTIALEAGSIKDVDKISGLIEKAAKDTEAEIASKNAKHTSKFIDSASTRVMKALGYEGVNVLGLPGIDNANAGSVIYAESLADNKIDSVVSWLEGKKLSEPGMVFSGDAALLVMSWDLAIDVVIAEIKAGKRMSELTAQAIETFKKNYPRATQADVDALTEAIANFDPLADQATDSDEKSERKYRDDVWRPLLTDFSESGIAQQKGLVGDAMRWFGGTSIAHNLENAFKILKGAGTVADNINAVLPEARGVFDEMHQTIDKRIDAWFSPLKPVFIKARKVFGHDGFNELSRALVSRTFTGDSTAVDAIVAATPGGAEMLAEIEADDAWGGTREDMWNTESNTRKGDKSFKRQENYYPMVVADGQLENLLQALDKMGADRHAIDLVLSEARKDKAEETGDKNAVLSGDEQGAAIGKFIFGTLYQGRGAPGFTKRRNTGEITEAIKDFIEPIDFAIEKRIIQVAKDSAAREFFGKLDTSSEDTIEAAIDPASPFGTVIAKARADRDITNYGIDVILDNVKSYFENNRGSSAASWKMNQLLGNVAVYGHLNNFGASAMNAADVFGVAVQEGPLAGIQGTAAAIGKRMSKIPGLSSLAPAVYTSLADTKFHQGAMDTEDFSRGSTRTSRFFRSTMNAVNGAFDAFGKEARLNAARINASRGARGASDSLFSVSDQHFARIEEIMSKIHPDKWPAMKKVLASEGFAKNDLDDLGMLYLRSRMSDSQPMTRAEQAQGKLFGHPMVKPIFFLKGFMLRQIGTIRNNVYEEAKRGNIKEASKWFALYAVWLGAGQALIRCAIAKLYGKECRGGELGIEAVLGIFGLNKYSIMKLSQGNVVDTATDMVIPPMTPFNDVFKDVTLLRDAASGRKMQGTGKPVVRNIGDFVNKSESIKLLPMGKDYYNAFGAGKTKELELQAKERRGVKAKTTTDRMLDIFAPGPKSK